MKKNKNIIIFILINLIFSFIINKISSIGISILLDFCLWLYLFFIYNFLITKQKKINYKFFIYYFFIYLINLTMINLFFLVFEINFLIVKIINLFITSILLILIKKNNNHQIISYCVYLVLFNLVVIFGLSSSMIVYGQRNSTMDYSVFRYIGAVMNKGLVPYKDVFDHKGILLYFINYIAFIIHKDIGIWLIEILFFYISIIFTYKIARLFTNIKCSLITCLITIICFNYVYNGAGNFSEQYAITFITISLYLFYKNFKNNNTISLKSSFIIGICMGAVLLLRPNMIAVWICMSIYILIIHIKHKKLQYLFKIILAFLSGTIIFILPFIIYLAKNNAISDFIYQYINFNFKYSISHTESSFFSTLLFFVFICKTTIFCLIIICYLLISKTKCKKDFVYFNLFLIILSFILVIQPQNEYSHYGFIMIPTYTYILSIFIDLIYIKGLNKLKYKSLNIIYIILFILVIYSNDIGNFIHNTIIDPNSIDNYSNIVEVIVDNSNENDNILIYGNDLNMYLKSNRYTTSKYPYQIPIIDINEDLKKEFFNQIELDKPKLIIISHFSLIFFNHELKNIEFLKDYECIYSEKDQYTVYKLLNNT